MRIRSWRTPAVLLATAMVVFFANMPSAFAIPAFSRKYQTSCLTCHTVYPVLNAFGEAFRRNGYRMPTQGTQKDEDQEKAATIPLGQEEYKNMFPNAVWPDKIAESVPIGFMLNGSTAINFPDSDANAAAGNTFTWDGIVSEFHVFAGGSFNNNLTYFGEVTLTGGGVDIEHGILLWNDIVGPDHMLNLWIGRLMGPSLTSWGMHSSYLNDSNLPGISIAGLYNSGAGPVIGPTSHTDGVEVNGIVGHRVDYALGWIVSTAGTGLTLPDAQDFYAHVGAKIGGMALDGEGPCGAIVPNPMKPWEETSLTLDLYGYSGLTLFDNGIAANTAAPAPLVPQNNHFAALGGAARLYLHSLEVSAGMQGEHHSQPYMGAPGMAGPPPTVGAPDGASASGLMTWGEVDYVVFPWLVPGLRAEYTRIDINGVSPSIDPRSGNYASLARFIPGVATLIRPNIKVVLTGDFETAYGLPPAGSWAAAGGMLTPNRFSGTTGKYTQNSIEAEQVAISAAIAF